MDDNRSYRKLRALPEEPEAGPETIDLIPVDTGFSETLTRKQGSLRTYEKKTVARDGFEPSIYGL